MPGLSDRVRDFAWKNPLSPYLSWFVLCSLSVLAWAARDITISSSPTVPITISSNNRRSSRIGFSSLFFSGPDSQPYIRISTIQGFTAYPFVLLLEIDDLILIPILTRTPQPPPSDFLKTF
jgi:hypothetical protein